jgi:hypothetical protein
MTPDAFLNLCKTELSTTEFSLLASCTLDPDTRNGDGVSYVEGASPSSLDFIDAWREWERALRLNLARYRAQKLKREAGAVEPPEYPAGAVAVAKAAVAFDSPLEAELFLDQARWNAIESLQGLSYFGENAVYAYLLKLLLLERKALFKAEEGFTEYRALYAAILEAGNANTGDLK